MQGRTEANPGGASVLVARRRPLGWSGCLGGMTATLTSQLEVDSPGVGRVEREWHVDSEVGGPRSQYVSAVQCPWPHKAPTAAQL